MADRDHGLNETVDPKDPKGRKELQSADKLAQRTSNTEQEPKGIKYVISY